MRPPLPGVSAVALALIFSLVSLSSLTPVFAADIGSAGYTGRGGDGGAGGSGGDGGIACQGIPGRYGKPGDPGLDGEAGGPGGKGGNVTWYIEDLGGGVYLNAGDLFLGGRSGNDGPDGADGSWGGDGGLGATGLLLSGEDGDAPSPFIPFSYGGSGGGAGSAGGSGHLGGGGGGGGGSIWPVPGKNGGPGGSGPSGASGLGSHGGDGWSSTHTTSVPGTNYTDLYIGGPGGNGGEGGGGGTGGGGGGGAGDCAFVWGYEGDGGARGYGGAGGAGGAGGSATLYMRSGAYLQNQGQFYVGSPYFGSVAAASSEGRVESGAIIRNQYWMHVGFGSTGTLVIESGGLLQSDGIVARIEIGHRGDGLIDVLAGGVVQNDGYIELGGVLGADSLGAARLRVRDGGRLVSTDEIMIDKDGEVILDAGGILQNDGEIYFDVDHAAPVLTTSGILCGHGDFFFSGPGQLANAGSLQPGSPAVPFGTLRINNNAVVGDVQIEIGQDSTQALVHDQIIAYGTSVDFSGGVVEVVFAPGFSESDLTDGDSFDIVLYDGLAGGGFAGIDDTYAPLAHGAWSLSYDHVVGAMLGARLTYVYDPTAAGLTPAPREFAFHPVRPNPFRTQSTIAYDLPRPARVELRIYDVTGRLVRTLRGGEAEPAGRHTVDWTGRTDGGSMAASGVYWARLVAGEFMETRTLTLRK